MRINQKKYKRLDILEEAFRKSLLKEINLLATKKIPKEKLNSLYLYKTLFPNAAYQTFTSEAESMLKMEKEIRSLRKSLKDEFSEVLTMIQDFKKLLNAHNNMGNSWTYAARKINEKHS